MIMFQEKAQRKHQGRQEYIAKKGTGVTKKFAAGSPMQAKADMDLGLLIFIQNDGAPKVVIVKWWCLNARSQKATITTAEVKGKANGGLTWAGGAVWKWLIAQNRRAVSKAAV